MPVMIVTLFCVVVGGSEPPHAGSLGAGQRAAGHHVPHAGHHSGASGLRQAAGRRRNPAQSQRHSACTQQTGIRQKVNCSYLFIVCWICLILLIVYVPFVSLSSLFV